MEQLVSARDEWADASETDSEAAGPRSLSTDIPSILSTLVFLKGSTATCETNKVLRTLLCVLGNAEVSHDVLVFKTI
jgi:hypothetical protein